MRMMTVTLWVVAWWRCRDCGGKDNLIFGAQGSIYLQHCEKPVFPFFLFISLFSFRFLHRHRVSNFILSLILCLFPQLRIPTLSTPLPLAPFSNSFFFSFACNAPYAKIDVKIVPFSSRSYTSQRSNFPKSSSLMPSFSSPFETGQMLKHNIIIKWFRRLI